MKKYLILAVAGLLFGMQGAKAEYNDELVKACSSGTHEKMCEEQESLYYLYGLSKASPVLAEAFGKWLIEHNIDVCQKNLDQISSLFLKVTKDREFIKAYILKANPQISPEEAEKITTKLAG